MSKERSEKKKHFKHKMDMLKLPDFIGCTLYIYLGNDRILRGSLVALDSQLNLLLDHVQERTDNSERLLGLVSIPQKSITSIKMPKDKLTQLVQFKHTLMDQIV